MNATANGALRADRSAPPARMTRQSLGTLFSGLRCETTTLAQLALMRTVVNG